MTPNPEVYPKVKEWVEKLDQPVRRGGLQNFTYVVENRAAEELAAVLAGLYGTGRPMMGAAAPGMAAPGMAAPGGLGAASGRMTPGGVPSPIGGVGRTSRGPMQIAIAAMPGGMLQSPVRIVPDLINNTLNHPGCPAGLRSHP